MKVRVSKWIEENVHPMLYARMAHKLKKNAFGTPEYDMPIDMYEPKLESELIDIKSKLTDDGFSWLEVNYRDITLMSEAKIVNGQMALVPTLHEWDAFISKSQWWYLKETNSSLVRDAYAIFRQRTIDCGHSLHEIRISSTELAICIRE